MTKRAIFSSKMIELTDKERKYEIHFQHENVISTRLFGEEIEIPTSDFEERYKTAQRILSGKIESDDFPFFLSPPIKLLSL
jgi:hypothetical protein